MKSISYFSYTPTTDIGPHLEYYMSQVRDSNAEDRGFRTNDFPDIPHPPTAEVGPHPEEYMNVVTDSNAAANQDQQDHLIGEQFSTLLISARKFFFIINIYYILYSNSSQFPFCLWQKRNTPCVRKASQ